MIIAREFPSLRELGVLDDAAVAFLRAHLVSLRGDRDAFLFTPAIVAAIEAKSASAELVALLRSALTSGGGDVEVHLFDSRTSALGISGLEATVAISPVVAASARVPVALPRGAALPTTVSGHTLVCSICKGTEFEQRSAQLHSVLATAFGVEWLGPTARCFVCTNCRHVEWFLD